MEAEVRHIYRDKRVTGRSLTGLASGERGYESSDMGNLYKLGKTKTCIHPWSLLKEPAQLTLFEFSPIRPAVLGTSVHVLMTSFQFRPWVL